MFEGVEVIRTGAMRKAFIMDLAFVLVLACIRVPGLTYPMKFTLAVIFTTITCWSFDIMPMGVVALIPLVAVGLSGLVPPSRLMGYYLQPIILMLVGVYLMGSATMRSGLALRMACYLMSRKWVGGNPQRIGLAIMLVSSAVSAYVSNTACVALFLPIVQAVIAAVESAQTESAGVVENGRKAVGLTFPAYLVFCLLLGSQASFALMVGSPVFLAANGAYEKVVGHGMSMLEWARVGVPMTIAVFAAFYLTINWVSGVRRYPAIDTKVIGDLGSSLGRMSTKEWVALSGLMLTFLLWLVPPALQELGLTGWFTVHLNKVAYLYAVPLYTSLLYFLIPTDRDGTALLDWRTAQQDINWGIVLLIAGALSFSSLFADKDIGLSSYIHMLLGRIGPVSPLILVGVCSISCVVLTSFVSSTGFMAMFASLVMPLAASRGVDLRTFTVMLSAMGCMDFLLPSGGAPGATAFSSGYFTISDMFRTNLPCMVAGVIAAGVVGLALM